MAASSSSPSPHHPTGMRSAWERWVRVWHIVYYLGLGLPTIIAFLPPNRLASPWMVLGLSLCLGLWYGLVMLWIVPRSGDKKQLAWSLIFLAGAIGLWLPLARSHPAYYITASSFYGLMWGVLPFGFALAGNVVLTGLIIWTQALNTGTRFTFSIELLLIGGVAVGWSALLALWMRSVTLESAERKRLIEQLEATQDSLAAAERQAGILQERQRLAQEIHDTLAQGFTSIVMQLEAADQALPEGSPAVRSRILQARDTARASLAEARRLVQALRPAPLVEASLSDALRRVLERWAQETRIEAGFTLTGEPYALHPEVEVTLLRAMQEALTNVYKHAQARQVRVTLSYMDDQIALDIQDDGCGFNPESPASIAGQAGGGYGLQAMRERLALFDGTVILESSPGQGTTLAIQIPMASFPMEVKL